MKIQFVILMISIGCLSSACAKKNITPPQDKQRVASMTGTWVLTHIGNVKSISKSSRKAASITIDTNAKTLTGYSGCNRMSGNIASLSGRALQFTPIAVTKRMCEDSKKESEFLQQFDKVEKYGTKGRTLYFLNGNDERLLTFERVTEDK